MHLQRQPLGFSPDWSAIGTSLIKGASDYNTARKQIQVETSRAGAELERARIAAAASAAAAAARARQSSMPLWRQVLPYAAAAVGGVVVIGFLLRR